jgi:diguanylate cyclase (GGDEF)-like protein/PAS domain S-box-containing protein
MQGPAVDIVMLLLLILFFGIQQRNLPEKHYRYWFVGWIFVLLSYLTWELRIASPMLSALQEAVRFDLLLLGELTFLLSFVATQRRVWRTVFKGMAIGVPAVLVLNLSQFMPVPYWLLVLVVILWQVEGMYAAYVLLPRAWPLRRMLVCSICVGLGWAMLVSMWLVPGNDPRTWALVEVMLCAAVLYGGGSGKRSFARFIGTFGLAAWAAFYAAEIALLHRPEMLKVLYEFWNLPKYFVGFSMILRVFEDANSEKGELAERYRSLYDDFRLMYDSHPYPMWIVDTASEQIVAVNREALACYGYLEAEFLQLKMGDLELPPDMEADELERLLQPTPDGVSVRHRFKDGTAVCMNLVEHAVVFHGRPSRLVTARDITHRVKANRDLVYKAHHDALTGLPNRLLFADRIQQSLARCEREGQHAVVLMIDVDHFKRVNDTHGHLLGDECLRQVAARLTRKIRQVDTIARVGGEEFVAVIGGLSGNRDAQKVAAMLLAQFEKPLRLGGIDMKVTVSLGAAMYPEDARSPEELMAHADRALYEAKARGRNRAVFTGERNTEVA